MSATRSQTVTQPSLQIIVARHGETQYNVEDKMHGHDDPPLTEKGKWQASCLKKALKEDNITEAYTSRLVRAKDTAKTVLEQHPEVELAIEEELLERDLGSGAGQIYIDDWYNTAEHVEPDDIFTKRVFGWLDHMFVTHSTGSDTTRGDQDDSGFLRNPDSQMEAIAGDQGSDNKKSSNDPTYVAIGTATTEEGGSEAPPQGSSFKQDPFFSVVEDSKTSAPASHTIPTVLIVTHGPIVARLHDRLTKHYGFKVAEGYEVDLKKNKMLTARYSRYNAWEESKEEGGVKWTGEITAWAKDSTLGEPQPSNVR